MKHAGRNWVFLLGLLSAFPLLSTDMYLPAIPLLKESWGASLSTINFTLVGFFISYCLCLLVYGPVSDRFGRKPPLLIGIGIYIISSLLCSAADNALTLIVFRIFQAAGAAAASTISLAISKDVFRGHKRQRILAYIAMVMALAPMLAPVLGGWLLLWFSWHSIFIFQAMIGTVAFFRVRHMPETLKKASSLGIAKTAGIYLELLRNRRYVGLVLMLSFTVLPNYAFIAASSDIYVNRFGFSEQLFGLFFAFNAASIMTGSFVCTRLSGKIGDKALLTASFAGVLLSGAGMVVHIFPGPWRLALPMALASFSFGLSRPPSNNLILEQVDRNAGAASSLMVLTYYMIGALSMSIISMGWADKIEVLGIMGLISGGIILATWFFLFIASTEKAAELHI
jgi:DHA1 family bicyclomycin/chloramphenicol resistance-like MFS transporter